MKYTLRQLRYFVSASDHGSITNAAKALNVSQPSVSTAIIHLESEYGLAVFMRKRSLGVELTPAGAILLREARMLLDHASDFDAIATNVADEISGEVRVSSFVNIAPIYLAGIIRSFLEKYPNVNIVTHIGNQQEVLESIKSGRFEIAVTFDLALTNEYKIDIVNELPPRLVVHRGHKVASRSSASLRDVIDEPFIFLDLPYSRDYFFSLFEGQGLRPTQTIQVASYETIRTFVGNGLGYSLLNLVPQNATNYDGTQVSYVPLEGANRPLKMCCVSLRRQTYRRVVLAFINHVKEYFT
jgi:DNA-binding transcriptional LysR family regulator